VHWNFFSAYKQNIQPKCDNPQAATGRLSHEIHRLIDGLQRRVGANARGTNTYFAARTQNQPRAANDQRDRR
jgi:hypothetical protein